MSKIIKKFTRRVPKWKPRVKPIEQREATQEQIESLKINCFCRKPNPGMFFEAAFNRNINLENSLIYIQLWKLN